jgi:hypothetical protein
MTPSESFQALRRANPRAQEGFERSVDAVADALRLRLVTATDERRRSHPRRHLVRVSAVGASLAVVVAVAAFLTVGSSGDGPGVESAAAAVTKAATLTAASAERSGTVVVRMTHNGRTWAGKTVRWNGADVAIAEDALRPERSELRVVDGTLYGPDPEEAGSTSVIRRASTPAAGRLRTSISLPCVRTSAASRCAGSPA